MALAAVLVVSACGGSGSRRQAVSGYIERVNAIQAEMQRPLLRLAYTYRTYGRRGASLTTSVPGLRASVRTLAELHARLEALQPPPDARTLHHDLVTLAARETSFAREVLAFARYVPAFRSALEPLSRANAAFRARLAAAKAPEAQAETLTTYRAALEPVVARIERLRPPPILVPLHRNQLASLRGVRRAAGDLAVALRNQDTTRLDALLQRFRAASQSASSVRAQRVQIAAVRAYNRRLFAIRSLAARVEQDRETLSRRLG